MTFHLRLIKDDAFIEFHCHHGNFRVAILDAFNQYLIANGEIGPVLEIKHCVHGWQRVYYNHAYLMIRSPLNLDFSLLKNGIYQTLQRADTWLTETQKLAAKQKAMAKERKEEAERRRNRFFIVR